MEMVRLVYLKAPKKLALNIRAERLSRSIARDYQIPFFTDRGKTEVKFQLKIRGSTGFRPQLE